MEYSIRPAKKNEFPYAFMPLPQTLKQTGCIGHLCGDFSSSSVLFTTWEAHAAEHKTREFDSEFDDLIGDLRSRGFLKDMRSLSHHCFSNLAARMPESFHPDSYAFRADTADYSYMFRLSLGKGDHNLYCYAYKKDMLNAHIAEASKSLMGRKPSSKNISRNGFPDPTR